MDGFASLASTLYPESPPDVYLSIGMFDGVHLGHQAVLRASAERAKANCLRPSIQAALTFHPHPAQVLAKRASDTRLVGKVPDSTSDPKLFIFDPKVRNQMMRRLLVSEDRHAALMQNL